MTVEKLSRAPPRRQGAMHRAFQHFVAHGFEQIVEEHHGGARVHEFGRIRAHRDDRHARARYSLAKE